MTRASHILNELFGSTPRSHYPYHHNIGYNPDYHAYYFRSQRGQQYKVSIAHNPLHKSAYIMFEGPGGLHVTGGHPDSAKIISTVYSVIKSHLRKYPKIRSVEFTGDAKHAKLYSHMVKRFTNSVPQTMGDGSAYYDIQRSEIKEPL